MSQLNIKGLVNNIKERTSVYTPLIEAIVNSIEAIDELGIKNGEIQIVVKRETTLDLDFDKDALPNITSIEVHDNGVGFNKQHRDSFDTLYGSIKTKIGGKGFGRFMFLKYFDNVRIESVYKENDRLFSRNFDFGRNEDIIENEVTTNYKGDKNTYTVLYLENIVENKLEKTIETIARKLVEKLISYFIDNTYKCPKIIVRDNYRGNKEIVLNEYIKTHKEIQEIFAGSYKLGSGKDVKEFSFKVLKMYYPDNQKSKISLVAHKREVTEIAIHSYIPEFEDNFYEQLEGGVKKDFMIKTYVLGDYLNENVSLERVTFNFAKNERDLGYPFSQEDIEKVAAQKTNEAFSEEIKSRKDKKRKKINDYIATQAPWHKSYAESVNFSEIPYNIAEKELEMVLQRAKYKKELNAKTQIQAILENPSGEIDDKLDNLIKQITEIGKSDLAHYVCNRKIVLEYLKKLLKRDDDGSSKYEKDIHNVIFPMGEDSSTINYEDHNLWVIDERLVFTKFAASDKKISKKKSKKEPDLVIFDQKKSFRYGDNEFSNPLTIFEFKRPKREGYKQDEDPIVQIGKYLKEIREGKYETPYGVEKVKVNENTPVYGYVVCDISEKIKEFATASQLTLSPDAEGYFGYHRGYRMYIEIMSFKKLLKDAELRNKIFFSKLGLS